MRLLDLENAMARQLGELPYPAYLCSMCVIGMELRVVYADLFPEEGRRLAGQTLDAMRGALASGDAAATDAEPIARRWQELIERPDVDGPKRMFSAMITFHLLARELAGELRRHSALEYVTSAAANLPDPRVPEPTEPQLIRVVPS